MTERGGHSIEKRGFIRETETECVLRSRTRKKKSVETKREKEEWRRKMWR